MSCLCKVLASKLGLLFLRCVACTEKMDTAVDVEVAYVEKIQKKRFACGREDAQHLQC